jgi:hypothetical protein
MSTKFSTRVQYLVRNCTRGTRPCSQSMHVIHYQNGNKILIPMQNRDWDVHFRVYPGSDVTYRLDGYGLVVSHPSGVELACRKRLWISTKLLPCT